MTAMPKLISEIEYTSKTIPGNIMSDDALLSRVHANGPYEF